MGNELPIIIAYTTFLLVLTAAWVGGYLDKYQHALQDLALGRMGENRASYGVKSEFPFSLLFFPCMWFGGGAGKGGFELMVGGGWRGFCCAGLGQGLGFWEMSDDF